MKGFCSSDLVWRKVAHAKGVIRSRKSRKGRHYNGKNKIKRQKDKSWSTQLYTENNRDNFEFIWLDASQTVMYAGMYYNPLDANSPKFSFSSTGINYTGKYHMILNT
jgi:hypothetical protein